MFHVKHREYIQTRQLRKIEGAFLGIYSLLHGSDRAVEGGSRRIAQNNEGIKGVRVRYKVARVVL